MPYRTQIPAEIIDIIIDELAYDTNTLKRCSTVSRSFFQPSRRNLFRSISLHNLKKTKQLYRLLTSTPETSLHIHELTVTTFSDDDDRVELLEDKDLVSVLGMVPRLRCLTFGGSRSYLYWERFPSNLQSALVDIFQSPCLTSVYISRIFELPLSILSTFTHVKKLSFFQVRFRAFSSVPAFALTRLEALDLDVVSADPEGLKYFNPTTSTFPNLRLVSVGLGVGEPDLTRLIITSSAKSIERVNWVYWPSKASLIALEVISNLRFLTFTTDEGGLASVAKYLRNRSITKSLTEFTIGLFVHGGHTTQQDFSGSGDLDAILSQLPTLRRVVIYIDSLNPGDTTLQLAMHARLPSLNARGILSVMAGKQEQGIWFPVD